MKASLKDKRVYVVVFVLFLLCLVSAVLLLNKTPNSAPDSLTECDKEKNEIMNLLEEARSCTEDSQCILAPGYGCPFGCYNIVNKNADLGKAEKLVEKYAGTCNKCMYKCAAPPTSGEIACKNSTCIDTRYDV